MLNNVGRLFNYLDKLWGENTPEKKTLVTVKLQKLTPQKTCDSMKNLDSESFWNSGRLIGPGHTTARTGLWLAVYANCSHRRMAMPLWKVRLFENRWYRLSRHMNKVKTTVRMIAICWKTEKFGLVKFDSGECFFLATSSTGLVLDIN